MVTAHSISLSIALQSDIAVDPILLIIFLIIAVLFIIIFFSWWFGVSDEDLDEVKEEDSRQVSGPAVSEEETVAYAEAEEDALATRSALLAEEVVAAEPVVTETAVVEAVEEASEPEPVVEAPVAEEPEPVPVVPDDFKKIEGIGPKIDELLKAGGFQTYAQLAEADVARIEKILEDAGPHYKLAHPASWPTQAKLAAAGDWDA
ncbi:MAG: hypothetical protein CSB13_07210, partial [Chloroflexi bacterium]